MTIEAIADFDHNTFLVRADQTASDDDDEGETSERRLTMVDDGDSTTENLVLVYFADDGSHPSAIHGPAEIDIMGDTLLGFNFTAGWEDDSETLWAHFTDQKEDFLFSLTGSIACSF